MLFEQCFHVFSGASGKNSFSNGFLSVFCSGSWLGSQVLLICFKFSLHCQPTWLIISTQQMYYGLNHLPWGVRPRVHVVCQCEAGRNLCRQSVTVCFFPPVFVFKPSEPRPLYIQKNVCREEVQWGVFVPRDVPESFTSEAYQWLNRSQFYFLTKSQVIASSKEVTTWYTYFSKVI